MKFGELLDYGPEKSLLILEVIVTLTSCVSLPVGRKCRHTATAGLRLERTTVTSAAVLVQRSLTCTHLLLAGNDSVLISMWCGGGIHSTK